MNRRLLKCDKRRYFINCKCVVQTHTHTHTHTHTRTISVIDFLMRVEMLNVIWLTAWYVKWTVASKKKIKTHRTIASKINVTPKGVYLPISKVHSIFAVDNCLWRLAHNNINEICYCGQISLQSAAVNCIFSDNLTSLGVTLILLAIAPFHNTWGEEWLFRRNIFLYTIIYYIYINYSIFKKL